MSQRLWPTYRDVDHHFDVLCTKLDLYIQTYVWYIIYVISVVLGQYIEEQLRVIYYLSITLNDDRPIELLYYR